MPTTRKSNASVTIRGKSVAMDTLAKPDALAVAMNVSPKVLRAYLRATYVLGTKERDALQPGGKASGWHLTRDAIKAAVERFAAKSA